MPAPSSATVAPATLSRWQLWMLVLVRVVLNSAFRLTYPLLPFLALKLEVSEATVNLLITIQVSSGLLSLAGGVFADRWGDRRGMALGLSLFGLGSLGCALSKTFMPFFLSYAVIGMGTALFMPSVQGYISRHTPYSKRGRAIGTLELAWAFSGILAVPLLTRLVEGRSDWTLAFGLIGASAVAGVIAILLMLNDRAAHEPTPAPLSAALRSRSVLAMSGMLFLAIGGEERLFIVQSLWQVEYFGLDTSARGDLFGLFSGAELLGSITVTLMADRIGLKRSVFVGYTLCCVTYLLLPASVGLGQNAYIGALLALGVAFEFALVASIPLLSELAPEARSTALAIGMGCMSTGRAVGSALGEPLWSASGVWGSGIAAALCTLLGIALVVRFVRGPSTDTHPIFE